MTLSGDRLPAMDIARGFALLGIVTMNIVAFALPESAYLNPLAWGGDGGADTTAWFVATVLFDGKMRGLFSLLFGASMLLAMDRAEMAGRNGQSDHIARAFWLIPIGLAHYLLLWWGDILMLYAIVSLIALPLSGKPTMTLVKLAFLAFALHFVIVAGFVGSAYFARADALAPGATIAAKEHYDLLLASFGQPGAPGIAQEIALYRGDWPAMFASKLHALPSWAIFAAAFLSLDTLGFMLLGMAMLKGGFLTGRWTIEQYRGVARHCFTIGLPPMIALALWAIGSGFDTLTTFGIVFAWSFPFRIPLTVGWCALIFWMIARAPGAGWLAWLRDAGRMTLSGYLLTSLVMTALFYGWGLGLFGHLSRAQSYLLLPPMWAIILLTARFWMRHFRFGPVEWLWRSLAQRHALPLRRTA